MEPFFWLCFAMGLLQMIFFWLKLAIAVWFLGPVKGFKVFWDREWNPK